MKFRKVIKSQVKELREKLGLTQQELADLIDVSRQTVYYLERGDYNPSLTLSFRISEVLNKPLDEIFYRVPVIKAKINALSLKKLKSIANDLNISYEKLISLSEVKEDQLEETFDSGFLKRVAGALGMEFDEIFKD